MATLLRIDTSVRGDDSVSKKLGDEFVTGWTTANPEGTVVTRDLNVDPLPHLNSVAVSAAWSSPESQDPAQAEATKLHKAVIDEILDADTIIAAIPLYNFSFPSTFKAWIDQIFLDPISRDPSQPLKGKKVVILASRGGAYGPGTPREGWDHAGPYLHRIFSEVLGMDFELVAVEMTLARSNPALAEFIDFGDRSLADALKKSGELGALQGSISAV